MTGVLLFSVVVTKLVDTIRNAADPHGTYPRVVWNLASFGLGLAVAFIWNLNALPEELTIGRTQVVAAQVLTGFGIGAVAGGWHEFFDFLSARGTPKGENYGRR